MNLPTRSSRKVLILKTGYIETLTNEPYQEGEVSLGDVLRTTAILHLFKNDFVVWLTDRKAVPLLEGNPYIREILEFNTTNIERLRHEYYDIVINLEKNPGICALASHIDSWQKYGFRFEPFTGSAEAYNEAINALYVAKDERSKKSNDKHWLQHLYAMVGQTWKNEGYVLREPNHEYKYGHRIVGLNWRAGHKFHDKVWPMERWRGLQTMLMQEGITTELQPADIKLRDYIHWISAHSVIVSCDSLGLHIGMALNKSVVGLFGPTPAKEIQPYAKGIMIQKESMLDIACDYVYNVVKEVLNVGVN